MALYRSVVGHVCTREGISDLVHSTIGVKQGCPLSPTLFGMYIDEVSDYTDREGYKGAQLWQGHGSHCYYMLMILY